MMSADQALTHLELLATAHKTMRGGSCVVQGQLDPFESRLTSSSTTSARYSNKLKCRIRFLSTIRLTIVGKSAKKGYGGESAMCVRERNRMSGVNESEGNGK
jgi:hypothetical protein